MSTAEKFRQDLNRFRDNVAKANHIKQAHLPLSQMDDCTQTYGKGFDECKELLILACEALRYYEGRQLEIVAGIATLIYPSPCDDKPKMPFYEGETWLIGEKATEALTQIQEKIGARK